MSANLQVQFYGLPSPLSVGAPIPISAKRAPTTSDKSYPIGQIWVYSANSAAYILVSVASNSATWQLIESAGGAGSFASLVVTPGPITMTGVTNINGSGVAATNIGAGTYTGTVTIGNLVGAAVTLLSSAVDIDSTVGGTISVGPSVTTGSFSIANALTTGSFVIGNTGSTSAGTVKADALVLDSKAAGDIKLGHSITTGTIEIGDALTTGSMVIGNTGSTSTVTVKADSLLLDSKAAGDIKLGHSVTTGTVEIADALTTGTLTIGNHASTNTVNIKSGSGGTNVVSGGLFAVDFLQATVASPTATAVINGRQCYANFTGFTTASGSSQVFIITNSIITAGSSILVTAINLGSNDAQMTVQRVLPGAGTVSITLKNNGAAALNGDVNITMWVMD